MADIYLSDNAGNRSSPTPESSQPVILQTALKLTNAVVNTNTEVSIISAKRYRFTAYIAGGFRFGLATMAVDDNVRWICPLYSSIEIEIPYGYTVLHYAVDTANALGFLVELRR